MSLLIEIHLWERPGIDPLLNGWLCRLGFIDVLLTRDRLSARFLAWRRKVEEAVRS